MLTNNPDKMAALAAEGICIAKCVLMVPRSWACRQPDAAASHTPEEEVWVGKRVGATMIGDGAVYGADLNKYLQMKVLQMGHMLLLIATGEADNDP